MKVTIMCTAITFESKDFYFGRTLDLEYSYRETVTIVPRNFPLPFRRLPTLERHHSMIGVAFVQENYPLFYDAVNEKGLCMAALNFPDNARYYAEAPDRDNISPFEFIPHVLGTCASLDEARTLLARLNLAQIHFSQELPLSPLHWMIADRTGSIVVEPTAEGMKVHENPVGVLTNNPPFEAMTMHLANYMALSPYPPQNTFSEKLSLHAYSRGMGAMGLPGDLSSASRFVRAAFVKHNSVCLEGEAESVGQFFHILGAVEQQRGCVRLGDNCEITVYTSCCNADKGIYYYTTYSNRRINAVDMYLENLEGNTLICYPLDGKEDIKRQN